MLRYLRESENGKYSIFKLYETTADSENSALNFYAVPVAGDGEILTAWADNTPEMTLPSGWQWMNNKKS